MIFQFMGKKGEKILEKQNREAHIDELLAQRTIYSIAKNYQGLLIIITVLLPIFVSIVVKFVPSLINQSNYIFALYLVFAVIGEKILEKTVDRLKKTSASIQERFDTKVLALDSNETLNTILIDDSFVRRYSKKAKKNKELVQKVTNWYSLNLKGINSNIASLLCQRTNITYDYSVRKQYKNIIYILTSLTIIALFLISLVNNLTLKSFLIEVVLPSIPVFIFSYKEINSNIESIDNLSHLRALMESILEDIKIDSKIQNELLRQIQNRIYYNRILSPLIPDFIYSMLRTKLEDEMNYSVEKRIEILRAGR